MDGTPATTRWKMRMAGRLIPLAGRGGVETLIPMMLRVSRYSATLADGVALSYVSGAIFPVFAQGRDASTPNMTTQRTRQSPYQGTVVEDIVAMVNDQA